MYSDQTGLQSRFYQNTQIVENHKDPTQHGILSMILAPDGKPFPLTVTNRLCGRFPCSYDDLYHFFSEALGFLTIPVQQPTQQLEAESFTVPDSRREAFACQEGKIISSL